MDVFVVPVGPEQYELYCEASHEDSLAPELAPAGLLARLRYRFVEMLRAADARQHGEGETTAPLGLAGRLQERMLGWVVERIAEQRLLWQLRTQTAAVAVHPEEMPFEQVMVLIRRVLKLDFQRHRRWLVIDSLLLAVSGLLAIVPGPNLVAYFFAFRVVGHYLSMRGAAQGLRYVEWTGQPCPPLSELRDMARLDPAVRDARIHDVAARLGLLQFPTFFERVAIRNT